MAAPFAVQQIDHVVFRVADLAASEVFYQAVLGCRTIKRQDDLGLIHLSMGNALLDLLDVNGTLGQQGGAAAGRSGHNVDHICLIIEPFDEAQLRAHLNKHGIRADTEAKPRFGAQGIGLSLFFKDIDGNSIELKGAQA